MSSKKKHIILILVLIALISFRYMTVRNHRAEKSRITIVLPQNTQEDLSSVQEGIRDYAYDHQIKLDVWYKKQMSEKGLYKNYTMQELLDELDVIEAFENPGSAVRVGEITKKQSQLYNTLGVVPPTTL